MYFPLYFLKPLLSVVRRVMVDKAWHASLHGLLNFNTSAQDYNVPIYWAWVSVNNTSVLPGAFTWR